MAASNYEYSSYSSSNSTGDAGANAVFNQVDTNRDGVLSQGEFSNFVGNAAGLGAGAGVGVGGAGGNYSSSSYEASSYSAGSGLGGEVGLAGAGFSGVGLAGVDASGLGGSSTYQSSSYESSSTGVDTSLVSQAAGYTAGTNAAWSQYGAEVRAPGLYVDSNPQVIRRQAPQGVQTYTQNIRVRFLQPPPVPPPGPLIIREVRPPQPPAPQPLRIRQQAPPLPQPPPLVLRERPPQPPATIASQTVVRNLAAIPVPPRSVIIERVAAAPPRPRDIIIERWVPYGAAAKRKTIVQRAGAAQQYAAPRNVIIQYEAAQVRIVRQFQRLGVTATNPQSYVQQYGASLLDAATLLAQARAAGVVEDLSPPAVAGVSSSSFSSEASYGTAGSLGGLDVVGGSAGYVGGDLAGGSSSFTSSSFESSQTSGAGYGADAALVGAGVGGGYGASSYESSSSYTSGAGVGGGVAGFDVGAATFNSADANRDGTLNAQEFNNFVQGGL